MDPLGFTLNVVTPQSLTSIPGLDPPHGIVVVVELPAVVDVVEELGDVVEELDDVVGDMVDVVEELGDVVEEVDDVDDPPWQAAQLNAPPLPVPEEQQLCPAPGQVSAL